jgi:hypothetical protein
MEGRLRWQQDRDKLATAMRQWQDADATHLSVSTMGASQKTVDDHLATLATAAGAADDQRLRAACGSRSQDLIFHVKLGFWNSGSRPHVRTVYYYVRMTASPGRRQMRTFFRIVTGHSGLPPACCVICVVRN